MRYPRSLLACGLALGVAACNGESMPAPADTGVDVAPADTSVDVAPADVPSDVASDVPSDAAGCQIPGYGECARGTSCTIGNCPDGTPISCFCSLDGQPRCTGACPPPDGGITCGEARGAATTTRCTAATMTLDPMTCRCILGWHWDGSACTSSARCRCLAGCDQLYPTREACAAAYAHCAGHDGGH